ncbi:MAG: glutamate synthase large subunit [Planctomycetota bacterium]|nr:glutamate synthase large subunit [Planctomycetota bacterium]
MPTRTGLPAPSGLYDPQNEHDACGVGFVANLDNEPSHEIVRQGIAILENLMHRGAAGGDPETGDGAGILTAIPDAFFRKVLGVRLPERGKYAVAMLFGGEGKEKEIEEILAARRLKILTWREVPVDPAACGRAARAVLPKIRQLFVARDENAAAQADKYEFASAGWERLLFVVRRAIEQRFPEIAVCSFSGRSIVYKGLLLAKQITDFYPDLSDAAFVSPLALVHQRYSTNTFPTWKLAHPFRYLAHNGEINALRGNLNSERAREASYRSELFADADLQACFPLIDPQQSDSACLDNMLELLVLAGRSLPHAMAMLIPQPWGTRYALGKDVRGFFEYHSILMEPWDGPAAVAFSDGINVGALLDRNGLRPLRWTLTTDQTFILASETGVLTVPPEKARHKGRIKPGEMIYCDLEKKRLIFDAEIKSQLAREKPYRRWVADNRLNVSGLFGEVAPAEPSHDLLAQQRLFGWSREDVSVLVKPMAATGYEPTGSMGNDSALAILSTERPLLYNYFKQLFAQVTNPPIDPIREELVMSLTTYIGNPANILADGAEQARVIKLNRPLLTDEDITRLCQAKDPNFRAGVLPMAWTHDLELALDALARDALAAVRSGTRILILSDRGLSAEVYPLPALLALSAVNRALVAAGLRAPVGIIVQSGEVREVMHYAVLLGFGATAINPYLALQTVTDLAASDAIKPDPAQAAANYIRAVGKGLLKIMSKMGISTLRSYRSAQIFEAVGLDQSVIDKYFPGTVSRVGGVNIAGLARETRERCDAARRPAEMLKSGGEYAFRRDGERHLWTPDALAAFRTAVQTNDAAQYATYARLINEQGERRCTLRGLFAFAATAPIPLEQVEPVAAIVKRFVSGAMSLGSISPEAHEAIAIAMNRLGGMSNSGEGGEDPLRETPRAAGEYQGADRRSAIRQVASGRFGVTIAYLAGAKELQIKMAQGAKPGEGGQLPGHKVNQDIARVRHSMPGVTLISPPPHHDIYSIEDLAQLIYDLRNSNPEARVSVKLVSEVGVGTVAAGVAKGNADVILISGHDGGTGASPLTSIKHAGLPWELGLAEAQQTLVLNHLRGRVRLQVDGQMKTGRDVVIGALLGAEEFGFATTVLVCLGCVMMRKCHENTCPVGVATQDPEMRKYFKGKPEYIENYLRLLAGEVREILAGLGLRSLDEAIGRSDLLKFDRALDFYKTKNLDFSAIFQPATGDAVRFQTRAPTEVSFDQTALLPRLQESVATGKPAELNLAIKNIHRTCGTMLSCLVARKFGAAGLPADTIKINLTGTAGQSFGAFLAPGVTLNLVGEANDYVGKGLSGGKIVIKVDPRAQLTPSKNSIAGNVIGYGATSGKAFFGGQVGERFAIRNSGATFVAEGAGDHGCEYMTGGRVVILGAVGVNFAAGMSGGLAYVYDENGDFDLKCNCDTVDLEIVHPDSADESELLDLIREHLAHTDSAKAQAILTNWVEERYRFVKVFPVEYKQLLNANANAKGQE